MLLLFVRLSQPVENWLMNRSYESQRIKTSKLKLVRKTSEVIRKYRKICESRIKNALSYKCYAAWSYACSVQRFYTQVNANDLKIYWAVVLLMTDRVFLDISVITSGFLVTDCLCVPACLNMFRMVYAWIFATRDYVQ